jgi:hypothetical protein
MLRIRKALQYDSTFSAILRSGVKEFHGLVAFLQAASLCKVSTVKPFVIFSGLVEIEISN